MSSGDSKKVVIAALAGNLAIAACKFGAALLSASTATLAEAVHSLADSGNQGLLLVGLALAARPADERYPFGRSAEKYFWAFVVALMLFSVGGAFAIYEGIKHLTNLGHAEHESAKEIAFHLGDWPISFEASYLNYAVLGTSIVFEALSFRVAFGEFKVMARGRPFKKVLLEAKDPTIPLVLCEDTAALIGLGIALIAVTLSHVTGQPWWDPVGSLIIGALLTSVAVILAWVTHGLLIGTAATTEDRARVLAIVRESPGVERVTQMLTMHLGPDVIILALKIAFQPEMRVQEIEDATNELERRLRAELPDMKKIFVEVDSHGDGRGVQSLDDANGSQGASESKLAPATSK
ncbi:cation diffusion facilitator family transporter [Pendulispora brunnea]|uniref:Cation diffusion facilitator family transporter n=1 Tax=Pendulispora brunnea TaxID=2905690 RepID=A0ABZ2JZX7_9BACT